MRTSRMPRRRPKSSRFMRRIRRRYSGTSAGVSWIYWCTTFCAGLLFFVHAYVYTKTGAGRAPELASERTNGSGQWQPRRDDANGDEPGNYDIPGPPHRGIGWDAVSGKRQGDEGLAGPAPQPPDPGPARAGQHPRREGSGDVAALPVGSGSETINGNFEWKSKDKKGFERNSEGRENADRVSGSEEQNVKGAGSEEGRNGGGQAAEGAGPIETFLARGKKLPVLLLTCNRANLLSETIKSLRGVRGMDMSRVRVLQDGTDRTVQALVEDEGLYLKQHTATPMLKGGPRPGDNGATRIAMHYKFSLNHVFAEEPEAPAVIIVEDDLLFSPDFLEFMEANAPVLERDPDTLVLSAWNDNGYQGRVSDLSELQRTSYFPGLGWLLSRKLYEELKPRWPREHWDHWLRDHKQHKGRECVFPEVPRTYHNGIKGTFMDQAMHDKLFKNIDYNTDPSFTWPAPGSLREGDDSPPYAQAVLANYERRIEARLAAARHMNDLDELPGEQASVQEEVDKGDFVFWYSLPQTEEAQASKGRKRAEPPFKPLSDHFHIWHEYKRAEHKGMHTFRYAGRSRVMLINADKSPYTAFKPKGLIPATMDRLRGGMLGQEAQDAAGLRAVPGDKPHVSCDAICSAQGMTCLEAGFHALNSCEALRGHFSCSECEESYGPDQPCYVEADAPEENYPGQCLVTSNPSASRCSASHALTRRLCPCRGSS